MLMLLLIIWLEMEMICSQLIVLAMCTGEQKIHQEEVHFGHKDSLIKTGKLQETDQEWRLQLFHMVQMTSTVLDL